MELGFETCGNATLIAYEEGKPVLVTDPWIAGRQYFGSWSLPYHFTPAQLEAFRTVRYAWFSHGHPDHLNLDSLAQLRDRTLLIPRHRGGRIVADLRAHGFQVRELPDGEWVTLSPRVRIFTRGDRNQDAAVLIALGDRCGVLNLNDGCALGTRGSLQKEFAPFPRRFALRLINYGDGDMMNFFTETGERIIPFAAVKKPLGFEYAALLKNWNATHTAPFSCHHMYSRKDSQWATPCEAPMEDHGRGFRPTHGEFIPGYFSYDAIRDRVEPIAHVRVEREFLEPRDLGDDWSETLTPQDAQALRVYFGRFEHVMARFEFLRFRVGRRDTVVSGRGPRGVGMTFEVPRGSLMTAVKYEIFDDLLLGNFMKTTLHGGLRSLYPDFSPYVTKYGDNGRAFSEEELERYFNAYRVNVGVFDWMYEMKIASSRKVRTLLAHNRHLYLAARRVYGYMKRA